jgi:hypothetical protein
MEKFEMDVKQQDGLDESNPVFFGNELFLLEMTGDDLPSCALVPPQIKHKKDIFEHDREMNISEYFLKFKHKRNRLQSANPKNTKL